MPDADGTRWKKKQLEQQLRTAIDALTPDVFDRLDLSVSQETPVSFPEPEKKPMHRIGAGRGAALAAAYLCLLFTGGGAWHYRYENLQIDSVIGLDVNPSVELSINRKERVLAASALNEDGAVILADMDLKGVELNVAVNAVVGSMVTCGYLDSMDNAILVTVNNDSVKKADRLRASVVDDIEETLKENQVQAVVYDQQVIEEDGIKELAAQYGISYGKAYFLKELIEENQELDMEDMEALSAMSMEEIGARIGASSLAMGELPGETRPSDGAEDTLAAPEETEEPTEITETTEEVLETPGLEEMQKGPGEMETDAFSEKQPVPESSDAVYKVPDEVEAGLVDIDYVDYENGRVYVYFVTRVSWKDPTVLIRDEEGVTYPAMVEEVSRDDCVIAVEGLPGGSSYSFVLGGLIPKEQNRQTTVTGYFDTPEIAEGLLEETEDTAGETEEESEESKPAGELMPEETLDSSEESESSGESQGEGESQERTEEAETEEMEQGER